MSSTTKKTQQKSFAILVVPPVHTRGDPPEKTIAICTLQDKVMHNIVPPRFYEVRLYVKHTNMLRVIAEHAESYSVLFDNGACKRVGFYGGANEKYHDTIIAGLTRYNAIVRFPRSDGTSRYEPYEINRLVMPARQYQNIREIVEILVAGYDWMLESDTLTPEVREHREKQRAAARQEWAIARSAKSGLYSTGHRKLIVL